MVQLPGREARFREPAFTDLALLADAIETNLRPHLDRPFAFFGHSMGALLGYEVAQRLHRNNGPTPQCLIASGCRSPERVAIDPELSRLGDDAFLEQLSQRYRAIPDIVRENAELRELVLPALRADFAMMSAYCFVQNGQLTCPITAFGGTGDATVHPDELSAWRNHTTGPFASHIFAGDHFFPRTAEDAVLAAVVQTLENSGK